ncbi:MAG: hypothetical protein ACE5I1_24925, partial [bacterium]
FLPSPAITVIGQASVSLFLLFQKMLHPVGQKCNRHPPVNFSFFFNTFASVQKRSTIGVLWRI